MRFYRFLIICTLGFTFLITGCESAQSTLPTETLIREEIEPLLLPESMREPIEDSEKGILYWQKTLYLSDHPEKYIGEPVEVLGFIYRREEDPKEVFFVGRLLLSCCYDDALPQGLGVYMPDNEKWENDQWVTVKGHWDRIRFGENSRYLIIPESISEAEPPEDPYIYDKTEPAETNSANENI